LWTTTCLTLGNGLSPTHYLPFCLSSVCLLKVCMEISFLPLPHSPVSLQHPILSTACSFSVPCLLYGFFVCLFLFLQGGESVCSGCYASLSQGWLWEYCMMLGTDLLVCQMSPKQICSWYLVMQEPSCLLSVMWH
jgi:hypothetical protein